MSRIDEEQSIISILDDVAQALKEAKSRFPGSTMAAVDRDYLLDLVYSARDLVPDQLARADELLDEAEEEKAAAHTESDDIIRRAQEDAEGIVREAREQASRLVSKDAITVGAKAEAQRIVDEARQQAEKLSQGADDYCDGKLGDLQEKVVRVEDALAEVVDSVKDELDNLLEQVDAGRSVIAERSSMKQSERLKPFAFMHKRDNDEAESATIVGTVPEELRDVRSLFAEQDSDGVETAAMAPTAAEPEDGKYI